MEISLNSGNKPQETLSISLAEIDSMDFNWHFTDTNTVDWNKLLKTWTIIIKSGLKIVVEPKKYLELAPDGVVRKNRTIDYFNIDGGFVTGTSSKLGIMQLNMDLQKFVIVNGKSMNSYHPSEITKVVFRRK